MENPKEEKVMYQLGQGAIVKLVGVTAMQITHGIQTGRINEGVSFQRDRHGVRRFNLELFRKEWFGSSATGADKLMDNTMEEVEDEGGKTTSRLTLAELKRRTAEVTLRLKEQELAKSKSELVSAAEVNAKLYEIASLVRSRLRSVPGSHIDEIMAAQTRVEALSCLENAIDAALTDLADSIDFG